MVQFFLIAFSLFFMSHTLFAQITKDFSDDSGKKSILSQPRPLSGAQEDDSVDTDEQHDDLSRAFPKFKKFRF